MKKACLVIIIMMLFVNQALAVDVSFFADKIQSTMRVESWGNKVGSVEISYYGKVNFPAQEETNFFGESMIDYFPIALGPIKFGLEANIQVCDPSDSPLLARGYLAARIGPFLLRYSPAQTDGNHKVSASWYWQQKKFSAFGYYDRNINSDQKAFNVAEIYIGYKVTEKITLVAGAKPAWSDGQKIELYPGIGIKWQF